MFKEKGNYCMVDININSHERKKKLITK